MGFTALRNLPPGILFYNLGMIIFLFLIATLNTWIILIKFYSSFQAFNNLEELKDF